MGSLLFGAAMWSKQQVLATRVSDHSARSRRQALSACVCPVFPRGVTITILPCGGLVFTKVPSSPRSVGRQAASI